jgi:hypothetical protein
MAICTTSEESARARVDDHDAVCHGERVMALWALGTHAMKTATAVSLIASACQPYGFFRSDEAT